MNKDINLSEIFGEAQIAAQNAFDMSLEATGDRSCCGFAWIVIDLDGRSKIMKEIKKIAKVSACNDGYKNDSIWYSSIINPKGTQSVHNFVKALRAACVVLNKYGIPCHVNSRLD